MLLFHRVMKIDCNQIADLGHKMADDLSIFYAGSLEEISSKNACPAALAGQASLSTRDAGPISIFNQSEGSNPVNFLYLKIFTLNGVLNLYFVQLMEVSIWLWCQVTEIWAVWQKEKACNSNCNDENHHFIA